MLRNRPVHVSVTAMTYPASLAEVWPRSRHFLERSKASSYIKEILSDKIARRGGRGRRFFGEAFVASAIRHRHGYYGSFKWLTNSKFLGSGSFGSGPTARYRAEYRQALQTHFKAGLARAQALAADVRRRTGITPQVPDLWLIERSGRHHFIEIKLQGDRVRKGQLEGLAVIAAALAARAEVSVEVIYLVPDVQKRDDSRSRRRASR